LLQVGSIVMVTGKNDGGAEALKVIVTEVLAIDEVRKKLTKKVVLNVDLDKITELQAFELVKLLEKNKGRCQCYINVAGGGLQNNLIYLTRKFNVDPNPQFTDSVRSLLGTDAVRLQG
ncbi:MAG: hypothetical protein WAV76_14275, partial [Bacteroidota bacterium]